MNYSKFKSLQGTNNHSAEVSYDDHYNLYPPESMRASPSLMIDTGGRAIENTIFSPDKQALIIYEQEAPDYSHIMSPQQQLGIHKQRSVEALTDRNQIPEPKKVKILGESPKTLRPIVERNRSKELYARSLESTDQIDLFRKFDERTKYKMKSFPDPDSPTATGISPKLSLSPAGKMIMAEH